MLYIAFDLVFIVSAYGEPKSPQLSSNRNKHVHECTIMYKPISKYRNIYIFKCNVNDDTNSTFR